MKAANDNSPRPSTVFLLMAQYNGKAVISVDELCRDYFPHLDATKFVRKVGAGDIRIPMVRMESSQKTAKGVHLNDLADYIDRQAEAARKDAGSWPLKSLLQATSIPSIYRQCFSGVCS
jgi:hypothetical protein